MTTLDELLVKLRAMASDIDQDWAADIQEGGSQPYPDNVPAQAADALEAAARENERLKRALRRIGKIKDPAGDASKWGFTGLGTAKDIARNALSGGPYE